MDISQVRIARSRRRTAAIQITPQGEVVFRAPMTMPRREIERILAERRDWIDRKLSAVREDAAAGRAAPLSREDLAALARQDGGGSALAEDGTVYRPRGEYRALYDAQYARYQKLYPALRGI